MKIAYLVAGLVALAMCSCGSGKGGDKNAPDTLVENKEVMLDVDGSPINCHGGGLLTVDGTTYWYGEHREGVDADRQLGVNCYSTKDFKNWKHEGIVFAAPEAYNEETGLGQLIERPKVVYNPKTNKYVLWFHNEKTPWDYSAAHAAVAVSDSPTGPFEFVRSSRVNPGVYPMNMAEENKGKNKYDENMEWWTPEWYQMVDEGLFVDRDLAGGQMSRDMTIYIDEDGTAYHIYSSEDNLTLNIAELNDEYTDHTGKYIRIMPGGHNEAPTIFKHDGEYWMITSGCTGWEPNKARMMHASEILGEWTMEEDTPFVGEESEITFGGQGTYVFDLDGQLVFLADIWKPSKLGDSRYLWLPINFTEDGKPTISYTQYLVK